MERKPGDYASIVRENHHRTTAYLLANAPPCTTIRDNEAERINRNLIPVSSKDLPDLQPAGSWLLAMILCPDDDLGGLAAWVGGRPAEDQDRVRFYAHPSTDLVKALKPWYRAGLDDPPLHVVSDWKTLHPPFGRDLNDRVYKDFKDTSA